MMDSMTSDSDKGKDGDDATTSSAAASEGSGAGDGYGLDATGPIYDTDEPAYDLADDVTDHEDGDRDGETSNVDEADARTRADRDRGDDHRVDGRGDDPDVYGADSYGYPDADDGYDDERDRYPDDRDGYPDDDDLAASDDDDVAAPAGPRHPLRLVLAAVLIGALVAGGVLLWRGAYSDHGDVGTTVIGENNAVAENDFTRSEPGDCLQWDAGSPGEPRLVDCAEPHRFEVAGRLDTASFPTSEFAASAPWPGPERFAAIRDENCPTIVRGYLGGGLDPQGRFAPGLMFPSKVQWERGARVLRCGIEQPGAKGVQEEFTGRVADIDQSFSWPIGTCVGIDRETRKLTGEVVSCSEPHAFQTTGIVDLSQRFGVRNSGKPWPSVDTQNDYLRTICPTQTNKFLGGAQKFLATTLNVQWSEIS